MTTNLIVVRDCSLNDTPKRKKLREDAAVAQRSQGLAMKRRAAKHAVDSSKVLHVGVSIVTVRVNAVDRGNVDPAKRSWTW